MTSNWMMMIIWMLVGAVSGIEFLVHFTQYGFNHYSPWLFLLIFIVALFFILKYRKLRNKEKLPPRP